MGNKEYFELIMGALLHDVGKFMQRAYRDESALSSRTMALESQLCPTDSRTRRYTHRHVLWTNEFFERVLSPDDFPPELDHSAVANIASYHHSPSSSLQNLVSLADVLSSMHDRRPGKDLSKAWDDPSRFFLKSIFEQVDIGRGVVEGGFVYPLGELQPGSTSIFPHRLDGEWKEAAGEGTDGRRTSKGRLAFDGEFYESLGMDYVKKSYRELWDAFAVEVKSIGSLPAESAVYRLADIMLKYTWCIPSSIVNVPDISLYDHSITTAVIAAAMYSYFDGRIPDSLDGMKEEKIFLLVGGDISGIQKYLYEISHIGVGGVAKRLRARSFFISLFSDVAAHRICEEFGMPRRLKLMSSGGNFTLLLPAGEGWEEKIREIRTEFDRWCYENLNAELRVSVGAVDCSIDELSGDFSSLYDRLRREIERVKNRGLETILMSDGRWDESRFVLEHVEFGDEESLCKSCRKFAGRPRDGSERELCDNCYADQKLGGVLPRNNAVAFYRTRKSNAVEILNRWISPVEIEKDVERNKKLLQDAYLVEVIGDAPGAFDTPAMQKYIANYIPVAGDDACSGCRKSGSCEDSGTLDKVQPLMFQCLAARAHGWAGLGFLKADVDNLGEIFHRGLKGGWQRKTSISRVVSLSRMVDFFFSARVDHLLRNKYGSIYTVYSGGDDLLFVGPWDEIIDFSLELSGEFRDYTCCNPNITISAGISLARPRAPISSVVREASEALERAKSFGVGDEGGEDRPAKNAVSLLNDCLSFGYFEVSTGETDFHDFLAVAKRLSGWLEAGTVNSSSVRKLYEFGRMAGKYFEEADVLSLRFVPYLAYDISRNWPGFDDADADKREAREWVQELLDLGNPFLKHLATAAAYAILCNRE